LILNWYQSIFILAELDCGQKPSRHEFIAGALHDAENNPVGEWPWMASLGLYENGQWQHQCGATLISHRHFLTAGHCLKAIKNR
jgi:secreted trypsin-like serine protease